MPTREFTVTLDSKKLITAEVEVTIVIDHNYGADADGNRGVSASWIDEAGLVIPISDAAWAKDDNGLELSPEERDEAERLLIKAAEEYQWDASEYLKDGEF